MMLYDTGMLHVPHVALNKLGVNACQGSAFAAAAAAAAAAVAAVAVRQQTLTYALGRLNFGHGTVAAACYTAAASFVPHVEVLLRLQLLLLKTDTDNSGQLTGS
jgi:hypothetical protein